MSLSNCGKVSFFLLLILYSQNSFCQDSTRVKKVKVLIVPTFGYSPETKTYIGAASLFTLNFYRDSLTRSSNAKVEFNYTWNKQFILESEWNYFFKDESWFTRGMIHYSKYPDVYYGVGSNTPDSGLINFESNRVKFDLNALKKIKKHFFIGMGFRYYDYTNVSTIDNSNPYIELHNDSNYGLKFIFLRDSRNSLLTPTSGTFLELIYTHNISSNYYSQLVFDLRKYYSLGTKQRHTIAGRLYNSFTFGIPPFYDYSIIGGDKLVRGYLYGRYRDNNLSTLQLEYRLKLIWRFGLATFGGISMVYPTINEIAGNNFKPNLGLGIRFLVDKTENTNLRFDYAIGINGEAGFYVSFGESF
jgi:hypothetical protein